MPTTTSGIELARLLLELKERLRKAGPVLTYAWGRHLRGRAWSPNARDREIFGKDLRAACDANLLHATVFGYQVDETHVTAVEIRHHVDALQAFLIDQKNAAEISAFERVNGVRVRLDGAPFFERFLNSYPRSAEARRDVRTMVKTIDSLREGQDFPATCVFIALKKIRSSEDSASVARALMHLHRTLAVADAFVLSTLFGAVVIIPDDGPPLLDHLLDVLEDVATHPFDLRIGVAHGHVDVVTDVDGRRNIIGPRINTAARLALSPKNDGCLVHESYMQAFGEAHQGDHWLAPVRRARIDVEGKSHDEVMIAYRAPHTFAGAFGGEVHFVFEPAVLISYDLSGFSRGDRTQLLKRFRAVTSVFARLKQLPGVQTATSLLAPGGDGGILVLTKFRLTDVESVAIRLRELGDIESLDVGDVVNVHVRVGVHYGQVTTYTTADGVARPAGRALFVVDALAGDKSARASDGVIVTRMIADAVSNGNPQQLAAVFSRVEISADENEDTAASLQALFSGIERFVRK